MVIPYKSICNSTIASGLVGLVAWGISLGLAHYGITVPPEQLAPIIITLMTITAHLVPDTLKQHAEQLDVDVRTLAKVVPQTYSNPTDFPGGKNGGTAQS